LCELCVFNVLRANLHVFFVTSEDIAIALLNI